MSILSFDLFIIIKREDKNRGVLPPPSL